MVGANDRWGSDRSPDERDAARHPRKDRVHPIHARLPARGHGRQLARGGAPVPGRPPAVATRPTTSRAMAVRAASTRGPRPWAAPPPTAWPCGPEGHLHEGGIDITLKDSAPGSPACVSGTGHLPHEPHPSGDDQPVRPARAGDRQSRLHSVTARYENDEPLPGRDGDRACVRLVGHSVADPVSL